MKRQQMWWTVLMLAATLLIPVLVRAQEAQADKPTPQPEFQFYRLSFTMKELEDGKVVNTRNYVTNMRSLVVPGRSSLIATSENSAYVRTGIRIPITSKVDVTPTVTYTDVGVNIDCRLEASSNDAPATALRVSMDISSLAPGEGGSAGGGVNPIIRSIRGTATVPFELDKPTLVTSVDDVTSKRQYQLEVTVTRIKPTV